MKKLFLFAAIAAFTFTGTGCDKTEKGGNEENYLTVTANNILFLSSQAANARLATNDRYYDPDEVIAEVPINGNGFTFTFNMQPKADLIGPVFGYEEIIDNVSRASDYDDSGINISNEDVEGITPAIFAAYDANGNCLAPIIYGKSTEEGYSVMMWIYVMDDVTVTGKSAIQSDDAMMRLAEDYNLTWKKGWNAFVVTYAETLQDGYDTISYSYDSNADTRGFAWFSDEEMGGYAKAPLRGLIERLNIE
jgi:hypothetical protein